MSDTAPTDKASQKYERELVILLRMRGQTEAEVARAITEVRSYAKKSGKPIADAVGTPAEFASQFPIRNSPKSRGGALRRLFGAALKPAPKPPESPLDEN
jgi:hypothetical protein